MPRPIINTVFTPRVKPTTEFERPRETGSEPYTCDNLVPTCDSSTPTCDAISVGGIIITNYTTPRKGTILQDLLLDQVTDLLGDTVSGLTGADGNIIVTKWI